MNRYQRLQERAIGLAFLLGPLLLIGAALMFVLGINILPDSVASLTEGVFGYYSAILFIVINLRLAWMLGQEAPVFGLVCAVIGLVGASAAVMAQADRVHRGTLVAAGVDPVLYQTIQDTMIPEMLAIGLTALLFPLTPILLGIGFLRTKALPSWGALALILAGVCFAGAQVTETPFGLNVLYPLSGILWLAALAPLGLGLLSGSATAAASRADAFAA